MPGQDLTDGVRAHPNRPLSSPRSWRVEDLVVALITLGVGVLLLTRGEVVDGLVRFAAVAAVGLVITVLLRRARPTAAAVILAVLGGAAAVCGAVVAPRPCSPGPCPDGGGYSPCRDLPPRTPVAHQPGHLMRRFRGQRPKNPLHVVVAEIVGSTPLLRPDEVLELQRIPDEEHRGVVPDDVQIALRCVELDRETPWITPGIGAPPLPRHSREPDQQLGFGPRLEHRGPGQLTDVLGHPEHPERPTALGMRLPLRDTLAVEVRHLLQQVMILQQQRPVRTHRQRMLVTGNSYPGIRRGRRSRVMIGVSRLT